MTGKPHVAIVGGGVIGISTAIALLGHPLSPYDVTIIAPDLPSLDHKSYRPHPVEGEAALASYASAWAGAHHVSDAKTPKQLKRDRITFDVLVKLEQAWAKQPWAQSEKRPLVYVHQTEYWSKEAELNESAVNWYPQYTRLPATAMPAKVDFGATFKTLDIDVPKYLPMLYAYFLRLGGRSIRHRVTSIAEAISLAHSSAATVTQMIDGTLRTAQAGSAVIKPIAVIASPGLGAGELLGDQGILPIRGQTVLLRAPWCTTELVLGKEVAETSGTTWCGLSKVIAAQGGYRDTYIIPRGDGTIICGGTRLEDDWDVEPRPETTKDILRRVLALMPQLERPKARVIGKSNGTDGQTSHGKDDEEYDVDIVDVNVGLRPGRRGGIRIERADAKDEQDGIPLIYNYGFGGIGYQSSWGAAFEARGLVDEALSRSPAPPHSTFAELDAGKLQVPDPTELVAKAHVNGLRPTNGSAVEGH